MYARYVCLIRADPDAFFVVENIAVNTYMENHSPCRCNKGGIVHKIEKKKDSVDTFTGQKNAPHFA